jgi:hypothetical protein
LQLKSVVVELAAVEVVNGVLVRILMLECKFVAALARPLVAMIAKLRVPQRWIFAQSNSDHVAEKLVVLLLEQRPHYFGPPMYFRKLSWF